MCPGLGEERIDDDEACTRASNQPQIGWGLSDQLLGFFGSSFFGTFKLMIASALSRIPPKWKMNDPQLSSLHPRMEQHLFAHKSNNLINLHNSLWFTYRVRSARGGWRCITHIRQSWRSKNMSLIRKRCRLCKELLSASHSVNESACNAPGFYVMSPSQTRRASW